MKSYFQILSICVFVILLANSTIIPQINGLKAEGKDGWKYGAATKGIVCGDRLCSELESQNIKSIQIIEQLPPLKQINAGVEPYEVICKNGFVLLLKISDSQPACVKPASVAKLVERGWTPNPIIE